MIQSEKRLRQNCNHRSQRSTDTIPILEQKNWQLPQFTQDGCCVTGYRNTSVDRISRELKYSTRSSDTYWYLVRCSHEWRSFLELQNFASQGPCLKQYWWGHRESVRPLHIRYLFKTVRHGCFALVHRGIHALYMCKYIHMTCSSLTKVPSSQD